MKFCSNIERVLSNMMNRDPSPSFNSFFMEFFREKQRHHKEYFQARNWCHIAFATESTRNGKDMSSTQFYSFKEYGHIAIICRNKLYNYCKQQGHIIKKCLTDPQNRCINACTVGIYGSINYYSSSEKNFTPEKVKQIILSTILSIGIKT